MEIRKARVDKQKNKLKKFILQEYKFLRDLEWFVSDHAITTKRKINQRKAKLKELFEEL